MCEKIRRNIFYPRGLTDYHDSGFATSPCHDRPCRGHVGSRRGSVRCIYRLRFRTFVRSNGFFRTYVRLQFFVLHYFFLFVCLFVCVCLFVFVFVCLFLFVFVCLHLTVRREQKKFFVCGLRIFFVRGNVPITR